MLRGAVLLAGSLLACAWVIVPLIDQRGWAATNESLQGTPLVNGYGAGRVIGWLVSGQLLDYGRLPVVTVFAGIGLVLACARCKKDVNARALLVALVACLLLSFGRAGFGEWVDVIPGGSDIFFRRFMMGIQLAALLLAGGGAASSARAIWRAVERSASRSSLRLPSALSSIGGLQATSAFVAMIVVLAPAWLQLGSYDRHNAQAIGAQRRGDATQGAEIDRLIELIQADGGGRVYAGSPSNWGADFTVSAVPVFKYLESRDVDVVGYTLRTASLMTNPESHFDEVIPSDFQLFGIHYLILPSRWSPPIPAQLILRAGPYWLWSVAPSGYVHVGRIVGQLAANRTNLGQRSVELLHSRLAQRGGYLRVAFDQSGVPVEPQHSGPVKGPGGTVISETDNLDQGQVAATVGLRQPGVVVLSASFDPGWTAVVDGHPRPTEMVGPALVATTASAGMHRIVFRYHGFPGYPMLFALCGLTLVALVVAVRR